MRLIDKLGRKTLLIYGSIGYIISLVGVAIAFKNVASPGVTLFFLCMFIASHAIGQGAVIWVFIAEIFPNKVRAYGQAFGSGVHWVMAALITLITPMFLDSKDGVLQDAPWIIFALFRWHDGLAVDLGVNQSTRNKREEFGATAGGIDS